LHVHIIPNIVKISFKRVEMNCCPGSKNSINGKTARYDRIFNELCHFYKVSFKGILKFILVIFYISWKLAIGSINDIYETLTRFLSMKLCKSDIIRSYLAVFANNWMFASWTKIHFDPFKWYFNDIRDYMGVQSSFGITKFHW
jgi:hypothetical protein